MANSPRLAKSAAVINRGGRTSSILVDGEEFPFYITDDISANCSAKSGVREVSVTILVDGPVSFYDDEALK